MYKNASILLFCREGRQFHEGIIFGGHNGFVSAVCILPPDDEFPHGLIMTGSNDHVIHAYTLDSPEPKYKLTGHSGNGTANLFNMVLYTFNYCDCIFSFYFTV